MKYKPETLNYLIIKETFAKKRMLKALSVQKKIALGRTEWQTDRQTDTSFYSLYVTRADARRPIAIYAQYMTLAININGVSQTGFARLFFGFLKFWHF